MAKKKKPRFLRRQWYMKSKLGRRRKNKQVWRKPKGRHIKTRLKFRGKSKQPSIGYRADRKERGRIHGLKPVIINNARELEEIKGMNVMAIISGNVGMLKKTDIAKKAIELKIKPANLDPEKFLDKIRQMKEKKKEQDKKGQENKEEEKKEHEKNKEEEKTEETEKTEEKESKEEKQQEEKEKMLMKEVEQKTHEMVQPKKAQKAPLHRVALKK